MSLVFVRSRLWLNRPRLSRESWLLTLVAGAVAVKAIAVSAASRSGWLVADQALGAWAIEHAAPLLGNFWVTATVCAVLSVCRPRLAVAAALLFDALVTALLLADLIHVQYFGDVLTLTRSVDAWRQLPIALGSLMAEWDPWWLLYFAEWPMLTVLAVRAFQDPGRLPLRPRLTRVLPILLLCPIVLHRLAPGLWTIALAVEQQRMLPRALVPQTGLLVFHAVDLAYGRARQREVSPQRRAADAAYVKAYLQAQRKGHGRSALFGAARGANLILISAESLQAFPLGRDVRGRVISPALNDLARQSLHFTRFQDQTGLGSTADAEFAVLHGLHPLPLNAVAHTHAGNDFRGLPVMLSEHGYKTISAVGARPDVWNMGTMHRRLGFSRSFFQPPETGAGWFSEWEPDRAFFARAAEVLQKQPEPFAAFLLSSSNHHPYQLPDGLPELSPYGRDKTSLYRYLDTVHYFDSGLEILLDRLRASGLLDRSIVVLYGDHQAFLGETADLASFVGFSGRNDRRDFFRTRKAVPLLIRLPGGREAGPRSIVGGHLDVPATILSLLGVTVDDAVMLGRDLTEDHDGFAVFRDGNFAFADRYYVSRGGSAPPDCFHIDDGEPTGCDGLASMLDEARERLHVSDLVIRENLVPVVVSPAAPRVADGPATRPALQD